jgi:hypothetical protein
VFGATSWRSAIGELVLIIGGVTIALAASSWYDDRQERTDERLVLNQLARALEVDLEELSSRYEIQQNRHQNVTELLQHLEAGGPNPPEVELSAVLGWVGVRTNSAPYEALKSRGFELISDESLRLQLIYYYENQFPKLLNAYLNDRAFFREMASPYFVSNFRQVARSTWVPLDYAALRDDPYFWNLCMIKLQRLENRILPYFEESLASARDLLEVINDELGE